MQLSTKQLTALKLFNARILLHTNNFKMQIQNDTVDLVRKLVLDVGTESSISNHSAPLLSKKRTAEGYGSDGEAGSEGEYIYRYTGILYAAYDDLIIPLTTCSIFLSTASMDK